MIAVAKMLRAKLHLKRDTQIDFYATSGNPLQQHQLVKQLKQKQATAIVSKPAQPQVSQSRPRNRAGNTAATNPAQTNAPAQAP